VTRTRILQSSAIFAASAAVTCVFFINLCNWIYQCGCQSLWAAAAAHCNVHNPNVRHCPFCAHGQTGYVVVLCLILIPQFALSWWPSQWGWRIRLMLVLLAFPLAALGAALALGWFDGYWS